mmetsp:Transcript_5594/g.11495  ORF Transcript_5594/g.11495 Transcript_5594/m.11495 type:complete len:1172 (-) Transcript_5594:82-3597(-)
MKRFHLGCLWVGLTLLSAAARAHSDHDDDDESITAAPRLDPQLSSLLSRHDEVRAIVVLKTDESHRHRHLLQTGEFNDELHQATAALQHDVLAQTFGDDDDSGGSSTHSIVMHRYKYLPAFVLTVTSADVALLLDHPLVQSIDADVQLTVQQQPAQPQQPPPRNLRTTKQQQQPNVQQQQRQLLEEAATVIESIDRRNQGNQGAGIVAAVLDTGYDRTHADLQGSLVDEFCFLSGECGPNRNLDFAEGPGAAYDVHSHGTHVSSIITSDGLLAPLGIAPQTSIVAVKVLNDQGSGASSRIVAGLEYMIDYAKTKPLHLINMSLGSRYNSFSGDNCDNTSIGQIWYNAFQGLKAQGVTVFVAAGNDGDPSNGSPACLSNVISVGASDDKDLPAYFTNSGIGTEVFAPGVDIVASTPNNNTAQYSGTSMATPVTVGCAALLMEAGDATTPNELQERLQASNVMVTRNGIDTPRINCRRNPVAKCQSSSGPPVVVPDCTVDPQQLFTLFDDGSTGGPFSKVSFTGLNRAGPNPQVTMTLTDALGIPTSCQTQALVTADYCVLPSRPNEQVVVTTIDGGDVGGGSLFDIRNLGSEAIEVTSLDYHQNGAAATHTIQVGTRPGGYVTTDDGSWTVALPATPVNGQGSQQFTNTGDFPTPVLVLPGQVQGFYISETIAPYSGLQVTPGTFEGTNITSDGTVLISEGRKVDGFPLGTTLAPFVFNGVVRYQVTPQGNWFLAPPSTSCDTFCQTQDLECNVDGLQQVDSPEKVFSVADYLGVSYSPTAVNLYSGPNPSEPEVSFFGGNIDHFDYTDGAAASCSSSSFDANHRRMCCCTAPGVGFANFCPVSSGNSPTPSPTSSSSPVTTPSPTPTFTTNSPTTSSTSAITPNPTTSSTTSGTFQLDLVVQFDAWPDDFDYTIFQADGVIYKDTVGTVYDQGTGDGTFPNTLKTWNIELQPSTHYALQIFDSWGDGLNSSDTSYYSLSRPGGQGIFLHSDSTADGRHYGNATEKFWFYLDGFGFATLIEPVDPTTPTSSPTTSPTTPSTSTGCELCFLSSPLPCDLAGQMATARGCALASMEEIEDREKVATLIEQIILVDKYWVGGSKDNGSWSWVDGSPVSDSLWAPGQPNGASERGAMGETTHTAAGLSGGSLALFDEANAAALPSVWQCCGGCPHS